MRIIQFFVYSSGVICLITGGAKLWSSAGDANLLATVDPVFNMPFRYLMIGAGLLELVIGGVCVFSKSKMVPSMAVAWLATSLLFYRLALWCMGWHRPCSCLGNLTDALHISPEMADVIMKGVLTYLLFGSYSAVFFLFKSKRKDIAPICAAEEGQTGWGQA